MKLDGQTQQRVKIGGKLSFNALPKDIQKMVKKRLSDKDPIIKKGLEGELPGIKIDGKVITKDNIKDFEINPNKAHSKEKKSEDIYSKEDLEGMDFSKLKSIAKKFGETGRSKGGLIKDILKSQK
jgi:hypothetical protein